MNIKLKLQFGIEPQYTWILYPPTFTIKPDHQTHVIKTLIAHCTFKNFECTYKNAKKMDPMQAKLNEKD